MDAGKGCNLRVNLYASVVTATPPRMTKRGDWVISATLIDDSYQALPMTINVFCKEKNRLPQLVWMGDVIRIHRAGLEIWNEKIQLVGLKPTQYVVIRKVESTWQACPTALNNFAFNPSDIERSQALWRWAKQHHSKENQSIGSDHRFTLAELHKLKKEDDNTTFQNRDITVMVIEKLSYQSSGVLPQGLLRVWDGTGNPPSDPLFMQSKILPPGPGEQREMAYARVLDQVMRASQQLQASLDFDNMGVPISLCGCASNVVVWEKAHWDLIHQHIPVGTFLRLRNVDTPQRWDGNEFRSIFMHGRSWMIALPTDNFEVSSLLHRHYERVRGSDNKAYNGEFFGGGRNSGTGCTPAAIAPLSYLPSLKFVGNGLSRFRKQPESTTARVFTGAVYVYVHVCAFLEDDNRYGADTKSMQIITVADRSGIIPVNVTEEVRRQLLLVRGREEAADSSSSLVSGGRTSLSKTEAFDSTKRFLVTILMFDFDSDEDRDGKRQYVLTKLAPID